MVLRALMNGKFKNSGSGALSNNTNIWTAKNSRNSGLRKELRNRGWIVRAGLATIQLMTVGAAKMLMRWGWRQSIRIMSTEVPRMKIWDLRLNHFAPQSMENKQLKTLSWNISEFKASFQKNQTTALYKSLKTLRTRDRAKLVTKETAHRSKCLSSYRAGMASSTKVMIKWTKALLILSIVK